MNDDNIKLTSQQFIELLDNNNFITLNSDGEEIFFTDEKEVCKWVNDELTTIFTKEKLNWLNIIFDAEYSRIIVETWPVGTEFFVFRKASVKDIQKII